MAAAYIRGASLSVPATMHFVWNMPVERDSNSSEVNERPLREIYLAPFEAAVKEGGTWCLMSSYNRINSTYASTTPNWRNSAEEWDLDGIVISDWFGTNSTATAANAGLDLEMPGPSMWRGERLVQAVQAGEVSQAV